jgi:hypothetical protein
VHSLCSLPLHLSGNNVHLGRDTTRARALLLCRDNIVRFHATCRDRNGGLFRLLREQWQMEQPLPQTDITPAAGYDPTTDTDTAWAVLAGHTLGDNHAFAADNALHTNLDEHEEQQPTTHVFLLPMRSHRRAATLGVCPAVATDPGPCRTDLTSSSSACDWESHA